MFSVKSSVYKRRSKYSLKNTKGIKDILNSK